MSPEEAGGAGGGGGVAGSQLYTGAQINFGDLTPYLTFVPHPPLFTSGSWADFQ
jgi:hypothetical protein